MNKSFFLRFALCLIGINMPLFLMAKVLKIVNLAPHQTIRIGSKDCGIGDTFNATDTIHWDHSLDNQAIKVICIQGCEDFKNIRECTKHENERKGSRDLSFASIKGMLSKGEEDKDTDPIVLWPGELISIEGICIEEGFVYSCRIRGISKDFELVLRNGTAFLNSDDFEDYSSEFILEIYKTHAINNWDIHIIKVITVERAK